MDVGAFIRAAAPVLSAIFAVVTATFAILLLTRRRLQMEAEKSGPSVADGRQVQPGEAYKQRSREGRASRLLKNFIEYVGNVSLTH